MFDTNTVSYILSGRFPEVDRRLRRTSPDSLCVSAITHGEVSFGLARRPDAVRLTRMALDFFAEIDVLPWTQATATAYGSLRADMQRAGRTLTPLDMLIAAHAVETGCLLISSDRAFEHVPGLTIEDWMG